MTGCLLAQPDSWGLARRIAAAGPQPGLRAGGRTALQGPAMSREWLATKTVVRMHPWFRPTASTN